MTRQGIKKDYVIPASSANYKSVCNSTFLFPLLLLMNYTNLRVKVTGQNLPLDSSSPPAVLKKFQESLKEQLQPAATTGF